MYFCDWIKLIPDLSGVTYLIPYVKIFLDRFRVGALEVGGEINHNQDAEIYLRYVVQIFAGVGGMPLNWTTYEKPTFS